MVIHSLYMYGAQQRVCACVFVCQRMHTPATFSGCKGNYMYNSVGRCSRDILGGFAFLAEGTLTYE